MEIVNLVKIYTVRFYSGDKLKTLASIIDEAKERTKEFENVTVNITYNVGICDITFYSSYSTITTSSAMNNDQTSSNTDERIEKLEKKVDELKKHIDSFPVKQIHNTGPG